MPHHPSPADWWRQACVYQIYPRSFADADRNGIGDFRGMSSRVPHFRALGVDAVCLSPHFPSALRGDGYDAENLDDVDLRLGTLDDFDRLLARLHSADIKLMITLLPNRDRETPEVRGDFSSTFHFWAQRGVDGFRIEGSDALWNRDDVHDLIRDWRRSLDTLTPPPHAVAAIRPDTPSQATAPAHICTQVFTLDLCNAPFTADAFAAIVRDRLATSVASGLSPTWALSHHSVMRHPSRYGLQEMSRSRTAGSPNGSPASQLLTEKRWLASLGRHPNLRRTQGLARARAATLFTLALPGSAYLYQGEELGLHEVADITDDERQDPRYFRTGGATVGNDGCRVPLPWTPDGPSYGFGGPTDIPQPEWFQDRAVSVQEADPDSTLTLYRRALALRRRLQGPEELEWIETGHLDLVAFERPGGWLSLTNFGSAEIDLPTDLQGELLLSSGSRMRAQRERIPAETTLWIRAER